MPLLATEFFAPADCPPGDPAPPPFGTIAGGGSLTLTYYDSFDWRLFRNGFDWAVEANGADLSAVCLDRASGRRLAVHVAAPPRFAAGLPDGKWRGRLAEALEMRELLPRVEIRVEREAFRVDGEPDSPSLLLEMERYVLAAGNETRPLPARWRLTGPKEARKFFRQLCERLEGEFELKQAADSLLQDALTVLGVAPVDPSALPAEPLDPNLRADAALKQVFAELLHTLAVNEAGVREGSDTEFLHDFRVAVRRTRSALGQIAEVFPEPVTARFQRGFSRLAAVTGEARDLDVYLLQLGEQEAELPEALRGRLEPLRNLLRARSRTAHARLVRYLDSATYRRLTAGWDAFLAKPPPRRPKAPRALSPIGELADRRVWKLYRRLLREGGAITPESPAEAVHDLRKTAKKLRYVMELFRTVHSPEDVRPLVRILKRLQDNLGEYQDIHVQIAALRSFSEELQAAGAPLETLLALGALLDRLYVRERRVRGDFGRTFAEFSRDAHQRRFRELYKPAAGTGAGRGPRDAEDNATPLTATTAGSDR
jgi:CHAD domain-containing protein